MFAFCVCRIVKLTSPSLSYVMILGVVMVILAAPTWPVTDSVGVKVDCIVSGNYL